MSRENLRNVRHPRQPLEHTLIQVVAKLSLRFFPEQIRTPHITDEQEVPGKEKPWRLLASRMVVQSPAHVLGCMSRGVDRLQAN